MKRLFALVLLAVGFATSAHADFIPATWTDTMTFADTKIRNGGSTSYTHDINDNGFDTFHDVITDFSLGIKLADDNDKDRESAAVSLPLWFLTGDIRSLNFGASGGEYGGWSIVGILALNTLGKLTVTISSVTGDFYLLGSTLTAHGMTNGPTGVPEPGALGLLGLGLVGMVVSIRRRKQAIR